jgi:CRP-like cAMP-binding protein
MELTLEGLIAGSTVFAGLSEAQLAVIAECATHDHFAIGERLFTHGEPADRFFLIRSGSVALEYPAPGSGTRVLETLHAREVAGWSWLFEPYQWQFDGRAVELTQVISFDGARLRAKCDADHELGYLLMHRFAESIIDRLQATRLQLLDVYGNDHRS